MTYISAQVTENKQNVIVWHRDEKGDRDYRIFKAPYYFYYPNEKGEYVDIHGKKLSRIDFPTYRDFKEAREEFKRNDIKLYESDIGPEFKILSQHYYNKPAGRLNVTFLDIEVDYDPKIGFSSVDNPYAPISAIALFHQWNNEFVTYVVPPSPDWTEEKIWETFEGNPEKYAYNSSMRDRMSIILCKDESQLLTYFLAEIENTDMLQGWNSSFFDLPYIYFRLLKVLGQSEANKLCFPNAKPPRIKEVEKFKRIQKSIELYGRISLDYLELFVKLEQEKRQSNSLEAISEELLPDLKKLEYEGSLADLYRNEFAFFVRYNIRDTEILKGLDEKLKYAQFSVNFSHAATGLPQNILGTIKLTELAIINYCHYELKKIVPDSKETTGHTINGAFVLTPQIGMYDWVSGLDVKSLYPSVMRSLNISPDTLVGQFVENNRAYEAFFKDAEIEMTFIYENGVTEQNTVQEWKRIFKDNQWSISVYGTAFSQKEKGVLTLILDEWFNKRIEYQNKMKQLQKELQSVQTNTEQYSKLLDEIDYYDKLQYVMKIRLNSCFGCCANEYFKFYDVRMGESITRSGREVLMHMARTIAEKLDGKYEWPSASVLYGDTDSTYMATHAENEIEALHIIAALCDVVNKSFQPFVQRAFLCVDKYSNLIFAEHEMVARKAIFVSKKYYILQMVNKNGKSIKNTKIMGHQVKKTHLPKHIKKRLIPYIEMIMDGVEWSEIGKLMVAYKDELKNMKILDIGGVMGINELEKHTDAWTFDPKCKLHGSHAAAIFYNKCLDDYNDKVSPRIFSGMKEKVYDLKKTFGRFHTIALPADIKHLPPWFEENFSGIIDRDAQVKKLVDNTMKNILNAIGKRMPTKKSLLVDELVEY